jgi:hypothetical protein
MRCFYSIHGSLIGSDVPLPEIDPRRVQQQGAPDVIVTLGDIASSIGPSGGRPFVDWNAGSPVLLVPDVARYRIVDNREIVIEPEANADFALVRLYVLGHALGLLLQQKGLFPLHASAVAYRGRAVAFAGHSGDGKSTLAAHCLLGRKGEVALLADDMLVTSIGSDGVPWAHVGMPALKLWRDTLMAIGCGVEGLQPDWFRADKFKLPLVDEPTRKTFLLAAVYELINDDEAGVGRITTVKGADAVAVVVAHSFCFGILGAADDRRNHFASAVRLASLGVMRRLRRRRDIASVAQTSALVLDASVPALELC